MLDDPEAPPSYSVHVSDETAAFHRLYRGECPVLRTMSGERLLNALSLHLQAHGPLAGGHLRFEVCGVLAGGSVTILPATLGPMLDSIDRRLQAASAVRLDLPHFDIDPDRREVVVQDGPDLMGQEVLMHVPSRRSEAFVTGGRFPIAAWVVDEWHPSAPSRTRAGRVYDLWSMLSAGAHHPTADLLARLRDLSALTVPKSMVQLGSKDLLDMALGSR